MVRIAFTLFVSLPLFWTSCALCVGLWGLNVLIESKPTPEECVIEEVDGPVDGFVYSPYRLIGSAPGPIGYHFEEASSDDELVKDGITYVLHRTVTFYIGSDEDDGRLQDDLENRFYGHLYTNEIMRFISQDSDTTVFGIYKSVKLDERTYSG